LLFYNRLTLIRRESLLGEGLLTRASGRCSRPVIW
jgi:hypothetical protein